MAFFLAACLLADHAAALSASSGENNVSSVTVVVWDDGMTVSVIYMRVV